MLGDRCLLLGCLEEPLACRIGVGHGLLGGEGLRGNQEEGGGGVKALQRFGDVGTIDVGDKVYMQPWLGIGRQGSASTILGPRSEPPMPMLTMSVMALPV